MQKKTKDDENSWEKHNKTALFQKKKWEKMSGVAQWERDVDLKPVGRALVRTCHLIIRTAEPRMAGLKSRFVQMLHTENLKLEENFAEKIIFL